MIDKGPPESGVQYEWGWMVYNETQDLVIAQGSWEANAVSSTLIPTPPSAFKYSRHAVEPGVMPKHGDVIQLKMTSFSAGSIHNGNGYQTLYAKNIRVYAAGASNFAETNEWIMFMTSSHYHWANSNIYKPNIYSDIMCFLNNRCHHRSLEYERSYGNEYDMIRTELCRVPPGARTTPGPRLHIFLSKSSNNLNYVFNTNDPYQGNLGLYAEHEAPPYDYYRSCPPMTPKPYKVKSVRIWSEDGPVVPGILDLASDSKNKGSERASNIVRVELDRPLRGTGRLNVGSGGWLDVRAEALKKEPYRTDENAILEYLLHQNGWYSCKRTMIGDYAANSNAVEGIGYRPFGACYPRFYFLKLIPEVAKGSILNTEPYAQMDFYFRGMTGAFINPYSTPIKWGLFRQTSALNWQFGELASRSSEEDPTLYNYIDPRNIETRGE